MWEDLLTAVALALILEGILPFFNPPVFRRLLAFIIIMKDPPIRFGGLACMLFGLVLLHLAR